MDIKPLFRQTSLVNTLTLGILLILWISYTFYMSLRPCVPDVFHLIRDYPVVCTHFQDGFFMSDVRDAVGHFSFYAIMSGLLFFEGLLLPLNRKQFLCFCIVLPIFIGGLIEFLQEYCTYTRTAEWGDFTADTLGTLLAFFVCTQIRKLLMKKNWLSDFAQA